MALSLSSRDFKALQRASISLTTSLDHEDLSGWLAVACRAVREATGVDSTAAFWRANSATTAASAGSLGLAEVSRYARDWHGRVVGEERRIARRLSSWVREDVWRHEEVVRTPYYHDYCIPAGFRDSAGMSVRDGQEERVVLYIATARARRFVPGGKQALLLSLMQPSLEAGARLRQATDAAPRLLDATDRALALMDLNGQLVHANDAFEVLWTDPGISPMLRAHAIRLARSLAGLVSHNRSAAPGLMPHVRWIDPERGISMHAGLWSSPGFGSAPLCVISVEASSRAATHEELVARWNFTPREAEVALLLARGASNKEVAQTLGTSPHTARHHTERVLQKLGAPSRASVARIIGEYRHQCRTGVPRLE